MPVHFEDLDVTATLSGIRSALIVPCNLCPAVTVAIREKRPFLRFFRSWVKSAPFEAYLKTLQDRLAKEGVRTDIFRNRLPHTWFMCMWTARRRRKLQKRAKNHDAVVVLGCESATRTVREVVPPDLSVIEGMRTTGIMNGRLRLRWPGHLAFENCEVVPLSRS
ncbi:MAG: hypothetical protein QNJ98_00110 [Planctomycetota bacterium]|nr:hypothetical protein [Planctomycetota bacterium]